MRMGISSWLTSDFQRITSLAKKMRCRFVELHNTLPHRFSKKKDMEKLLIIGVSDHLSTNSCTVFPHFIQKTGATYLIKLKMISLITITTGAKMSETSYAFYSKRTLKQEWQVLPILKIILGFRKSIGINFWIGNWRLLSSLRSKTQLIHKTSTDNSHNVQLNLKWAATLTKKDFQDFPLIEAQPPKAALKTISPNSKCQSKINETTHRCIKSIFIFCHLLFLYSIFHQEKLYPILSFTIKNIDENAYTFFFSL